MRGGVDGGGAVKIGEDGGDLRISFSISIKHYTNWSSRKSSYKFQICTLKSRHKGHLLEEVNYRAELSARNNGRASLHHLPRS